MFTTTTFDFHPKIQPLLITAVPGGDGERRVWEVVAVVLEVDVVVALVRRNVAHVEQPPAVAVVLALVAAGKGVAVLVQRLRKGVNSIEQNQD